MFHYPLKFSVALALLLGAFHVQAVECQLETYTLTSITAEGLAPVILDQNATDCAGLYTGNQSYSNDDPDPNIGTDSNGLLNGEHSLFDPVAEGFITEDDLQNLNDTDDTGRYDGLNDDPGWIFIAGEDKATMVDGELVQAPTLDGGDLVGGEYGTLGDEYGDGLDTLNLSEVVNVSITCDNSSDCKTGAWSVEVLDTAYDLLPPYLGDNIFDHLTFVVSAGGYWGIFDFNMADIFKGLNITYPEPGVFEPAFTLSGVFDLSYFEPLEEGLLGDGEEGSFGDGYAVSHWSVHARDPGEEDNEVPTPGTLYLLGIGLLGFGAARRLINKLVS